MRIKRDKKEIEIDEILLDSSNIPGYSQENLEGVVENPISQKIFWFLGSLLVILGFLFVSRVAFLQVINGENFLRRSQNNYLRVIEEDSERGVIYDRYGNVIAENKFIDGKWRRIYPSAGFLHVLGFLTHGGEGVNVKNFGEGASGLEAQYDEVLRGTPNKFIEEVDAANNIIGSGFLEKGEQGRGIITTLDSEMQTKLSGSIASVAKDRGFKGGAAVILEAKTGEILALSSVPEFDPNILFDSSKSDEVRKLLNSSGQPFLNRAVTGLYPPGSIVKPALAAAALQEKIIDPKKQILSTGSITLPNPYNPQNPNIFPDWKAHGLVDMKRAIAFSSNVYFYEIGGGYMGQKGLGAENIKKYLGLFGFGEKSGVDIPGENGGSLPDIFAKQGGRDWTIGDTYNLSIGQGDILVTPLQMSAYVASLASFGSMPYPHLVKAITGENAGILETFSYSFKKTEILPKDVLTVAREGMRDAVLYGTAHGLGGFSIPIAAKTGTAEIGDTGKVHSWSIGFFPYEDPKIAFAIFMEAGPRSNNIGATFVASEIIRWMLDTDFLSKLDSDIVVEYAR